MSVVIIGGNECMERRYCDLCRQYGCKAKVFCKPCKAMGDRIGDPDMIILFTNTVSHKMIRCALTSAGKDTSVIRSHTSSLASLQNILKNHVVC